MAAPNPIAHGSSELPSVVLDHYNIELRDDEGGFLGDRASFRAFMAILEDWRDRVQDTDADGEDPLGDKPGHEIGKKRLDETLLRGDPEAAGVVLGAIEEFAQELATVTRRFLRAKGWRNTQRIVVGGGLRDSRLGELAIGRASVILKAAGGIDIDLVPIHHHPDEAGLVGAAHLMPSWMFAGHDSLLAVDIGGTNIRAGLVALNLREAPDLSRASVWKSSLWRHRDGKDAQPSRDDTIARLADMLQALVAEAEGKGLKIAPFVGVGCPGLIREDGTIERGGQNLPGGNWETGGFSLARSLAADLPEIGGHETVVLVHNDAVVQGLSQVPFIGGVERWGVLTVGTGLGNARFTNRALTKKEER